MRGNVKKGRWNRFLYISFWLLIVVACAGLTIVQLSQYNEYRVELTRVEDELEQEQKVFKDLQDQMVYYDSDAYIEQIAREQLGYVRSDEIVFINTAD